MSERLNKIDAERERARLRKEHWEERFKELDRKFKEQENVEIHDMVHAQNLTVEQLGELLRLFHEAKLPLNPEETYDEVTSGNDNDEEVYSEDYGNDEQYDYEEEYDDEM